MPEELPDRSPFPHLDPDIPANCWIRCRGGYLKVMPPGDCTPFDGDRHYVPLEDALAALADLRNSLLQEFREKLELVLPGALFDPGQYVERRYIPTGFEDGSDEPENLISWQHRAVFAALDTLTPKGGG